MLLNDVVLGKVIKLTTNSTNLTEVRCMDSVDCYFVLRAEPPQPPSGYDAVVGEPGGDLNYDESIGRYKTASDRLLKHMLIPK
jgi:hypothetical protein